MPRSRFAFGTALLLAAAPVTIAAATQSHVSTFDDATDDDEWMFGFGTAPMASGGNPGGYLFTTVFDYPLLANTTSSKFLGNYRSRGVTSVGVDYETIAHLNGAWAPYPMTVMLTTDNATPGDPTDDWSAWLTGDALVPLPGAGWKSFEFEIPAQALTLPPDWQWWAESIFPPASPDWNIMITHVTRLRFWTIDPGTPTNFPTMKAGADNPRITWTADGADLDGDGIVGGSDLGILLANWNLDGLGDLDGDGKVGGEDLAALLGSWT